VSWATTPHSTDVNANAIRWGTMYNFRFDSNSPPVSGPVTIGLFKPGPSTNLVVPEVLVPGEGPSGPPTNKRPVAGPPAPTGPVGPVTVP
jgi:hypothetical protein